MLTKNPEALSCNVRQRGEGRKGWKTASILLIVQAPSPVNERSKSEHSSGSPLSKTPESQRHMMAVGKALLVNSRSALVVYLKCYYFLSYCS